MEENHYSNNKKDGAENLRKVVKITSNDSS